MRAIATPVVGIASHPSPFVAYALRQSGRPFEETVRAGTDCESLIAAVGYAWRRPRTAGTGNNHTD